MKSLYFYQISKGVMFATCFSIVFYMAKKEIARYLDNKDTSSVAIRKFGMVNDHDHQYPTLSICFFNGNVIYSYPAFKQTFKKPQKAVIKIIEYYRKILEGYKTYNESTIKSRLKMARYPTFSSLTIKLEDLIHKYGIAAENSTRIDIWNYKNSDGSVLTNSTRMQNLPFSVSFQTPRLICFTLENHLTNDIHKMGDILDFKEAALQGLEWHSAKDRTTMMKIYIHAPGQLIRNLDKPIINLASDLDYFNGSHTIAIKRVDVLHRRQDAKIPCKLYPTNEDKEYLRAIVKDMKCIPVYWESLQLYHANMPVCNSTDKYVKLREKYNGYNPTPKRWLELRWVPCYEMVVSTVDKMRTTDKFRINIQYQDLGSQFFETINARDFGFENLWSSFGGIVGIFLGYSVVNLFEMISNCLAWIHDKLEKKNDFQNNDC